MKKQDIEKRRKDRFKTRTFVHVKPIVQQGTFVHPRRFIDAITTGESISSSMKEHTPLPPDGEAFDDWDTGTEEMLDLVDAAEMAETAQKKVAEYQKAVAEQQAAAKKKAFEEAVAAEVAKRAAPETPSQQ